MSIEKDEEIKILEEIPKLRDYQATTLGLRQKIWERKTRSSHLSSVANHLERAEYDYQEEINRLRVKLSELRGE